MSLFLLPKVLINHIWSFLNLYEIIKIEELEKDTNDKSYYVLNLCYNKNNILISTTNKFDIKLWDLKTKKCIRNLKGHEYYISNICIYNDYIISSCAKDKLIFFWNTETGKCIKRINLEEKYNNALALAIISKDLIAVSINYWKAIIQIWNIKTNKCIISLNEHKHNVHSLLLICTNILISGSDDKSIKIWDLNNYNCINTLLGHESAVTVLCKINNKIIASGSMDRTIRIWNINSGKCLHVLEGHVGFIISIKLYSKNTLISTSLPLDGGSNDSSIKFWNIQTGICIYSIPESNFHSVRNLEIINNNKIAITSSNNTIKLITFTPNYNVIK